VLQNLADHGARGALGSLWAAANPLRSKPPNLRRNYCKCILNADEYRQEITDIGPAGLRRKLFDKDRRALLATKLGELAARVKAAKDSHFWRSGLRITRLADGFKKYAGTALRSQLPNQWMRIRQ